MKTKLVSSLEKIFPGQEPVALKTPVSLLKEDFTAFQVAFYPEVKEFNLICEVAVDSPLSGLISMWQVENVPVRTATISAADGDYISDQPGLYPDLLMPDRMGGKYVARVMQWNAFWFEVETTRETEAGTYPVTITVTLTSAFSEQKITETVTVPVTVINAVLPKQELKRTEWFHADCVADFYHAVPFSEEHWRLMEDQLALAAKRGVNMLMTPIFTPCLDTYVGGERTTVQLIDITVRDGAYTFGFEKLRRWIEMAWRNGIEYFEMVPLYTQWGAAHCPKIMAEADGVYKRIFGWDDDSTGEGYRNFLAAMLPALTGFLEEMGLKGKTYFHISDEPRANQVEIYHKARAQVDPYLVGWTSLDALNDYEFYKTGACPVPVIGTNCIEPFLEDRPKEFWVYYCVGQYEKVSNRFIAMPSSRNRIIAEQLYKYDVDGFLQWGYNFYNSIYSYCHIDPFFSTDSGSGFPAGDPFLVYPGDDGKPWPSIRLEVFWQAICDLRAFKLLESLTDKAFVMGLIEEEGEVTFSDYPRNADYHLNLREKVNQEIAKRI